MPSLKDLEEIITRDCDGGQPPVFLHPGDVGKRNYDDEEIDNFRLRDFQTRLFIFNSNIEGKTVALRTKFSDNHTYSSHLNVVRDFVKAVHATKNFTAAKTNQSEILSKCFQYSPDSRASISKYYTFAISIASGLSNFAENTKFEHSSFMVTDRKDEQIARLKMCLLMDIIFSKISIHRFLVYEEGSNTFRVAFCRSNCSRSDKGPFIFAIFSFLMQFCLTAYVVAENIWGYNSWNLKNLPLAILTLIYGSMLIYPSLRDKDQAYQFYGNRRSFLQMMDFFINHTLSVILVFSGFAVIMIQEDFIEAVLNSAALLFIPEIDDQLPSLLGFDEKGIIENYLISQSLQDFSAIAKMSDEEITQQYLLSINKAIGIEFNDHYLTNIREQPSHPEIGEIFQPYQVAKGLDGFGHQIEPSNFVTANCLIRKLVWSYTTYNPNGTKPRIGYLKIETMTDEVIEIKRKGANGDNIIVSDVRHKLEGAYIITSFQMSNDIIRLRVCGSRTAKNFSRAFEYYSLWEVTPPAQRLLQTEKKRSRSRIKGHSVEKNDEGQNYFQLC